MALTKAQAKAALAAKRATPQRGGLLSELGGLGKTAAAIPADVLSGLAEQTRRGINEGLSVLNAPLQIAGLHGIPSIPRGESINQLLGLPTNVVDRGIQDIAGFIPFALGGGVLAAGKTGAELAARAPEIDGGLAGVARSLSPARISGNTLGERLGRAALEGSAYGAAQEPSTPLEGGLLGGALNVAVPVAGKGILTGLRKMIRGRGPAGGQITAAELQARAALVPQGIHLPIGDIANSPAGKKLYSAPEAMIFSGANRPYEQLRAHVGGDVADLYASLGGHVPSETLDRELFEQYQGMHTSARLAKNQAYDTLAAAADGEGIPFDRSAFDSAIAQNDTLLKGVTRTDTGKALYGDMLSLSKDMKAPSEGGTAALPNFQSASNLDQLLNAVYKKNLGQDGVANRTMVKTLKDGLRESMNVSSAGTPELMGLSQNAKDAYQHMLTLEQIQTRGAKPQISPFKQILDAGNRLGGVYNTGGFVADYLKPDISNRNNTRLTRLLSQISPQQRAQVAHQYLFRDDALKEVTPNAVLGRFSKLSDFQKTALLPDGSASLESMGELKRVAPHAFSVDYIPKTGFTGAKGLQLGALGTGVLGSLLAGHVTEGLGGAAAYLATGQSVQRALRSRLLRELYLHSLQGKSAESAPGFTGSRALTATTLGGNQ